MLRRSSARGRHFDLTRFSPFERFANRFFHRLKIDAARVFGISVLSTEKGGETERDDFFKGLLTLFRNYVGSHFSWGTDRSIRFDAGKEAALKKWGRAIRAGGSMIVF